MRWMNGSSSFHYSRGRTMASTTDIQLVSLIGAARSGTTLVAEHILAHHPDVTYWSEPNHVWSRGNIYNTTDRRDQSHATPGVTEFVRRQFAERLEGRSGELLLEKTPGNCLRVPFVREVFPETRFIHLVRDGRDVALSAAREWRGGADRGQQDGAEQIDDDKSLPGQLVDLVQMIIRQIAIRGMHTTIRPRQIPYYVYRLVQLVRSRLFGRERLWGPHIPELREIRESHTLLETCAIQWCECVETAAADLAELPEERRIRVRYEDLLDDPAGEAARILEFLDREVTPSVQQQLETVEPTNKDKWRREMSSAEQRRVGALIDDTLERFGYAT